jgi:hypothetical protein
MNILSLFRRKKTQPFIPTQQFLIDLPQSDHVLAVAQNKELTETKAFSDLLSYFQHFPFKEELVLQNINQFIYAPKKSIYEVSSLIAPIVRSLQTDNTQIVNFIRRLGLDQRNSYLFFIDKPSDDYSTIDQKSIDQLVGWMKYIVDYYEQNKTSMDENHEQICEALFSKLGMLYDFFYFLLCHLANVRCDNLETVTKQVAIEF